MQGVNILTSWTPQREDREGVAPSYKAVAIMQNQYFNLLIFRFFF